MTRFKTLFALCLLVLLGACNNTDTTAAPQDLDRTDNDDTNTSVRTAMDTIPVGTIDSTQTQR